MPGAPHPFRGGRYRAPRDTKAQDLALVVAFVALALFGGSTPVSRVILAAIFGVLAWGFATLHYPREVTVDDEGVRFRAYGRSHAFAWRDVTAVSVRRFLVKDRALVRLAPSPPWRGRYWLLQGRGGAGFEEVVRALESRRRATAGTPPASPR